jgi:hypothetical protein
VSLRGPAGAVLAAVSLLAAGCSGTPEGGDPGGKGLAALRSDPVFATVPEGATLVGQTNTPAKHRDPGFQAGGWAGPSVVLTFKSDGPPEDVYGDVARRAEAAGWKPSAKGSRGVTDRWTKTYPDGAPATLLLAEAGAFANGDVRYRLSGSVPPV